MSTDNPAQRLYELLEESQQYKSERSCREVWEILLGTTERPLLMERLGKVMGMPRQVLMEIERHHPGHSRHHAGWVAALGTGFGQQNLDGQWNTFRAHVNSHVISQVAMAAAALQGRGDLHQLPPDEISRVAAQIQELLKSIPEMDLPPTLANYLVQQLHRMAAALDEYRITGSSRFVEILEATLGHIGSREEYRDEVQRSAPFKNFMDTLAGISHAVTIGPHVPLLVHAAASVVGQIGS